MKKQRLPLPRAKRLDRARHRRALRTQVCQAAGFAMMAALALLVSSAEAELRGTLELEPCHLDNYPQEVLCGSHEVFEDRAHAEGRKIEIRFAVVPAVDETSEDDPLVIFPGGPGQAALDMAPLVASVFRKVNESRDVVLIDQRGMGSSDPLECEEADESWGSLSVAEQERLTRELLQRCLDELDADVTLYTQDLANQDIHEILQALGYRTVNIYGGSWGTRAALLYDHQFPEAVRTLVLDGSLPLSNPAPLYATADAEAALRALFSDCSEDPNCSAAFPDLDTTFDRALAALEPEGTEVTMDDPATGEPRSFVMTRESFVNALRNVLYLPELSRIVPLILEQAAQSEYRALAAVADTFARAGGLTIGAHLTIMCSEEGPRMAADDLERETGSGFLGRAFFETYESACAVWPRAPLPAIYGEEMRSQTPALILSGALDPITPPRWGEAMTEALPNSLHLIATGTGHGVAPKGCASELIEQFIETSELAGLEGDCLREIERPSFFVDASGPAVGGES